MYLSEKYGYRWLRKHRKLQKPHKLNPQSWLKDVLFNPSSRLARTFACSVVELMCTTPETKQEVFVLV